MSVSETVYWMEVFQAAESAGCSRDKCELMAYEAVRHIRIMNLPKYD